MNAPVAFSFISNKSQNCLFYFQNPTRHPVNIRDQTLEALSDALYVAPVIETGDYHSSLNARSWFYVFEYQTKNSFFKQVGPF